MIEFLILTSHKYEFLFKFKKMFKCIMLSMLINEKLILISANHKTVCYTVSRPCGIGIMILDVTKCIPYLIQRMPDYRTLSYLQSES